MKEQSITTTSNGFIKLDRNILNWEWYRNRNVKDLFLHCLLKANHTDKNWEGIVVKRGSFVTGRKILSRELGMSEQQIRTALDKLKATKEITIKSTSQYSILTINNYNLYQSNNQLATNEQPTSNQRVTTTKELKKEKKEKNIDFNDIKSWWNSLPYKLVKVQVMSEQRISSLNARVKEIGGDIDIFKQQVELAIKESDYLQGKKNDWVCNLDFVLQKKSFIKMIEGNYKGTKNNNFNDILEGNF